MEKKQLHSGPFSLILGQTRIFLETAFLSLYSASRFISLSKISEKTNTQIPRKTGARTDARMDRQA